MSDKGEQDLEKHSALEWLFLIAWRRLLSQDVDHKEKD